MRQLYRKLPPSLQTQEAGLALFFLIVVPYLLWRASLVSTFWIDEMYTVTLVNHSFLKALELTTFDAHPPGYYFFLKLWLKPFRLIGIDPGLLLTRLPGIIAWMLMGVAAFRGAERIFGRAYALLGGVAVCFSANALYMATDARQYSIVIPTMFGCWLLLMLSYFDRDASSDAERRSRRRWAWYAILGGVSLWFQLLTAPMLATLGTLWLLQCARRSDWKCRHFRHGVWAHIAIALIISPWLGALRHNLYHLDFMPRPWQTPATPLNLLSVFFFWAPLGNLGYGLPWPPVYPHHHIWFVWNVLLFPGLASLVVPVRTWILARTKPRAHAESRLQVAAWSGLGTMIGFTFLIWWFDRWGVSRTFHGMRYPMVGLGLWVFGLVALCAYSVERLGWPRARAWALMAPWLFCALLGHVMMCTLFKPSTLTHDRKIIEWSMPPKGTTVYTMPTEFIPCVRRLFPEFDLKPIEELAHVSESVDTVHVFDVSPLVPSYKARDSALYSLLKGQKFADNTRIVEWPQDYPELTYFQLRGFRHDLARRMAAEPLAIIGRDIPPGSVSVAVPEEQSMLHGWSVLEIGDDMTLYRWGTAPRMQLRFDRALEPGRYTLHLVGYHSKYPTDPAHIRLAFLGEREAHDIVQPGGGFHIVQSFQITSRHESPLLLIDRPTWVPRDFEPGVLDPRELSILLNYAWVEKE